MKSPPSRSAAHRALLSGLVLLVVLAVADTGLWWFATGRLETELATWQAQRRAAGWAVTAGQPERTGWPLTAAIQVTDVALAGGDADLPGGFAWRATRLELSVALLRPRLLNVRVAGDQRLRFAEVPEFGFTAERFEVAIPLDPGVPARSADLAATGLHATPPAGPCDIGTLAVHVDTRPAAAQGENGVILTASAEAIGLPPLPGDRPWPFGPRIASVSLDAALTGPLPGAPDLATRAAAWRDGGGTLVLRRLALGWGPLGLSGSATMALDEHMQPMGAATVRLVGYDATLDALVAAGAMAPRAAVAAKGVLTILARTPEGGGSPRVELPVTLQDRTLTAGRFPLLRLPQWVWQ